MEKNIINDIKRQILLLNYDTKFSLTENIDRIFLLNEANAAQATIASAEAVMKMIGAESKVAEDVLKVLKNDFGYFKGVKADIKSMEKVFEDISSGAIPAIQGEKIMASVRSLPIVKEGFLAYLKESVMYGQLKAELFPRGPSMPHDPLKLKKLHNIMEKQYGFKPEEVNRLFELPATAKVVDVVKGGTTAGTAAAGATKLTMSQRIAEKWKALSPRLKKRFKIGLASAAILGTGGAIVAGSSIFGGYTTPEETGGEAGQLPFPKCVNDLLELEGSYPTATTGGDPIIVVPKTGVPEYDQIGGLQFFTNNRVISKDQSKKGSWSCSGGGGNLQEIFMMLQEQELTTEMNNDVENMIDYLDFPVYGNDLKNAYNILKKYATNGKGKEFLDRYTNTGLGKGSLTKTLDNVWTTGAESGQLKQMMLSMIQKIESGKATTTNTSGEGTGTSAGIGGVTIKWDGETVPGGGGGGKPSIYTDKPDFPFVKGNRNPLIKEIQACLGLPAKYQTGNFGPITEKALIAKGYDLTNGITKEMYDKIKSECGGAVPRPEPEVVNTPEEPTPDIPPVDLTPSADVATNVAPEVIESPYQLYARLYQAGNFTKPDKFRMKYKGPDLTPQELTKLDSYMTEAGYTRIKQKDKEYGVKYVYQKIQ